MALLALILALGILQILGSDNTWHRKAWFYRMEQQLLAVCGTQVVWLVLVVVPTLLLWALGYLLRGHQAWWLLISIGVLLFCLARGEFRLLIQRYIDASRANDYLGARQVFEALGGNDAALQEGDWPGLHSAMLAQASYNGFERTFAVLFWFVLAGPGGAFLYRASQLTAARQLAPVAPRWLWFLEWPAARLLGLTFAFTGNFVGCVQRWVQYFDCFSRSTEFVVTQSVLGALTVTDGIQQTAAVTRRELSAMQRLFDRTLWFWLGILALLTIAAH